MVDNRVDRPEWRKCLLGEVALLAWLALAIAGGCSKDAMNGPEQPDDSGSEAADTGTPRPTMRDGGTPSPDGETPSTSHLDGNVPSEAGPDGGGDSGLDGGASPDCDQDCGARGTCMQGACECAEGYAGAGCEDCADDFVRSADSLSCVASLCAPDSCPKNWSCNPATGACCATDCTRGATTCSDGKLQRCVAGNVAGCNIWSVPESCGSAGCRDDNACASPDGIRIDQWGSPDMELVYGVAATSSGAALVVGSTVGMIDGQTPSMGQDIFVSARHEDPTKNWTRLWSTPGPDFGQAVVPAPDGAFYLAGGVEGGAHVSRWTAGAVMDWSQPTAEVGVFSDRPYGLARDASGNLYVAGRARGGADAPLGGDDALLTKLDAAGVILWSVRWGTTMDERLNAVAVDASGVYTAGYTQGAMGGGDNAGDWDAFVAKHDLSGKHVWTRQFGSDAADEATALAISPSGALYVGGISLGTMPGTGGPGAFLGKWGTDGTPMWLETWGGYNAAARGVAVETEGSVLVVGWTLAAFGGAELVGKRDVFITRWQHATGGPTQTWSAIYGTDEDDLAYGLALAPGGIGLIAGHTKGAFPGYSQQSQSAFLLRVPLPPAGQP